MDMFVRTKTHKQFKYKSKIPILYFSFKVWRLMYLVNLYKTYAYDRYIEKRLMVRSSYLPLTFVNTEVFIYTGRSWVKRSLSLWSMGFKVGVFTWNRRYALFKPKKKKKK